MKSGREPVIVVAVAVLSLSPVMAAVASFPAPSSALSLAPPECVRTAPYSGSVELTPGSSVLLPTSGQWNVSTEGRGIGFQLNDPADFSGSWVSTSPTAVLILNVSRLGCIINGAPPPARLNGSFNGTLFPGNYVVLVVSFPDSDIVITATTPWMAAFDRGLDVLQSPAQVEIPDNGTAAWTLYTPADASRYFLEAAIGTNSCDFELAVLPSAVYRAFVTGQGPFNGSGTEVLEQVVTSSPGTTGPCGLPSGPTYFWGDMGPYNWTSGDVVAFYNAADYGAVLYPFAPLEVSYLIT